MANISTVSSTGLAGTIEGTGARYQSLEAWESGQQNVTTEPEIVECFRGTTVHDNWDSDGADVETVLIAWATTSPANPLIIRAAVGEEIAGVSYRDGGTGFVLKGSITSYDSMVIEDIEIDQANSPSTAPAILNTSAAGNTDLLTVDRCMLAGTLSTVQGVVHVSNPELKTISIRNTVVSVVTNGWGIFIGNGKTTTSAEIVGCTVYSDTVVRAGIVPSNDNNTILSNTVTFGFADDYSNTTWYSPSSSDCASGDTSAVTAGIGTVTGVTTADFVTYPTDLYPAPAGKLYEAGPATGTYPYDIVNNNRVAPWDIGAYETVSAGPTPAVLSNHTTTAVDETTATIGCTTDTSGGTLYWYLSQSNVAPTPAELKAGTNAEQFGNLVPTAGQETVDLTGLTSSTEYWHYWIQETT